MRTTPAYANVFDINALLHPGAVFSYPRGVIADPHLSLSEKRATSPPGHRTHPPSRLALLCAPPVSIDKILDALSALDSNGPPEPPRGKPMRLTLGRAARCWLNWLRASLHFGSAFTGTIISPAALPCYFIGSTTLMRSLIDEN